MAKVLSLFWIGQVDLDSGQAHRLERVQNSHACKSIGGGIDDNAIENAVVTNFETNQKTAVYDMEKAAGKDPYEMFLSGSVSLLTIENPSAKTDKELVIFRDSFASSLAPLLLEGYAKITLVDIRYLPSARLGSFVTFDKQDVLFLYSVPVLNNSETIK